MMQSDGLYINLFSLISLKIVRPDWLFIDVIDNGAAWLAVLWSHRRANGAARDVIWSHRRANGAIDQLFIYRKANVRHYWLLICIGWALRSKLEKKRRHVVFIELLKKSGLERVWPIVRTKRWTMPFNTSLIKLTEGLSFYSAFPYSRLFL